MWGRYININGENVNKEQSARIFRKGFTKEVTFKLGRKSWEGHSRQMGGQRYRQGVKEPGSGKKWRWMWLESRVCVGGIWEMQLEK